MESSPLLLSEPWIIDRLAIERRGDDVVVVMEGWAFPDPDLDPGTPPASTTFLWNGRPFAEVHYPLERGDVGNAFWQRRNAWYSGFRCVASAPHGEVFRDGVLELTYVNPGPPRRIAAQQSWYFRDDEAEGSFPDAARRVRVIGDAKLDRFILGGLTDFHRLDAAASEVAGRSFAEAPRILDWGCGCGRIARYTARVPGVALSGCDIDADNVAWCAGHLSGRFHATAVRPPLPFAGGSFDLVYGVSVFTHLREPLQDAWLAELERVTVPGAILLLTVHGRTALDYAHLSPDEHRAVGQALATQGLWFSGMNTQIDGHAEHEGEYVNVFHSADYIREHWGRHFEVVALLPGYIYTHDLVVLRRR